MYVILLQDIYSTKPIVYFTDLDKAKRAMKHFVRNSRCRYDKYILISLNLTATNYPEYKQGINLIIYNDKMYNDICTCLLTGDYKMLLKMRR